MTKPLEIRSSPVRSLSLCIVIPAYNEALRLPSTLASLKDWLRKGAFGTVEVTQVLVIDDGSTDDTVAAARRAGNGLPGFDVFSLDARHGKGFAVREGLRQARSAWALIADADLSATWQDSSKLVMACQQDNLSIALGSRGTNHVKFLPRRVIGRTFNYLVRKITGLPFDDTQCGFKVVSVPDISPLLPQLAVDGFAWDVELLLLARRRELRAKEVLVIWEHQPGSKVRLVRDSVRMLSDVLSITRRISRR